MDYDSRASHSSQRERVIKAKEEIYSLMVMGVPLTRIQRHLDLDDIPKSTFHYHASRIAKANRIGPQDPADEREMAFYYTVRQPSTEAPHPSPPDNDKPVESASTDEPPAQLKSVVPVKVVEEEPRKRVKHKRRRGGVTPNLSVKEDEFDTSKWSSKI